MKPDSYATLPTIEAEQDPVRLAFIKVLTSFDSEVDFKCPEMKGILSVVSLDDCEGKARGLGCAEMLTCPAYQRMKKQQQQQRQPSVVRGR